MTFPEPPASEVSPWWTRHGASSKIRRRLFCFPFAGGGAAIFRQWQSILPRELVVVGVQLPGRESRFCEPAFRTMEPLVEQLAAAIRPSFDRPVAFFGHSAGALVAFELARTLEAKWGLTLDRLIVAGCNPPHLQSPLNYTLQHLDNEGLIAALRRLNGTPQAIFDSPELMSLFLPVVRADIAMAETYTCPSGARLSSPITAMRGALDGHTDSAAIERWGELTGGEFAVRVVPGDHFFPLTHRTELLEAIGEALGVKG